MTKSLEPSRRESQDTAAAADLVPGKTTQVETLARHVQRRADAGAGADGVQAAAAQGTSGPSGSLPFLDQIQQSFGPAHDLSGVQAHTDGAAAAGSRAMGATAFASGDHVAFGGAPDLHTAAHEAAHVVQQRGGVQLKGGVGEVGDPYEQHADAVADRVVAGVSAASLLGGMGGVATAAPAPGGAIQRKTDPHATPDPKEASWTSPSKSEATEAAHVGSIFFHTKRYDLEAADEAVLHQLAKAYAPWAKRNIGHHGAPLGLKGNVIGYADPRPSQEPNNQELSLERAHWTAMRLARALAAETGLAEGYFEISETGGGVDAAGAPSGGAEDPMPHSRRADIFLEGKAGEPEAKGEAPPVKGEDPKGPVLKGWEGNDWDGFEHDIRRGDQRTIRDLSLKMLVIMATSPTADQLYWAPTSIALAGKHQIDPFERIKPPWWDARTSQIDLGQGRGAAARKGVVYNMLLLKRDYKETIFYEDTEYRAGTGVFLRMMESLRTGHADEKLIAEAHTKMGYLLFMIDAVSAEALDVAKMTGFTDE